MRSLRHAFRALFKSPFLACIALASLALGIGVNVAIFSVVDQLLLRPLPVMQPGQLVNLAAPGPNPGSQSCNGAGGCDEIFTWPMFQDLSRAQSGFAGIAAHRTIKVTLDDRGPAHPGEGTLVSGSYFSVLGLRPALGRLIAAGDDSIPGGGAVAVLSQSYWRRAFTGDPAVVGQSVMVNGHTLQVIGVAPAGFDGTTVGSHPDVFVPMSQLGSIWPQGSAVIYTDRRFYLIYLFGRLKPGVTLPQAESSINIPYHAAIVGETPLQTILSPRALERFRNKRVILSPGSQGQSLVLGRSRTPLLLLLGVTVVVLLIACANIANLLLAKGAARAGEMALRLSLGATRSQVVRQLLVESCLLAAIGGVAGLIVARATLSIVAATLSRDAASTFDVHLDSTVLLFAMAVTLGTGVLFGIFPALHATRPDLIGLLKGQSGQSTGGRAASRFRTSLVTLQIALSTALLISAGLFVRSLMNVSRVDLGIKVDHLVTFGVSPDMAGYAPEAIAPLVQRIEAEMAAIPGVTAVGESLVPLLTTVSTWGSDVGVEGYEKQLDVDNNSRFNAIAGSYLDAVGIHLIAGRAFTPADRAGTAKVAIVNQSFVRKFHLGSDPIGKRMDRNSGKRDIEIVGLMQDAKYNTVKGATEPQFVVPLQQSSYSGSAQFYVRGTADPAALQRAIPSVLARVAPNLPVERLVSMTQQVDDNIYLDRFIGVMSAAFASLATLLASIGLYGVLAYTIAQRTQEIGLRMALGATPARVRWLVLGQVSLMAAVGIPIGVAGAVELGRIGQSMLFGLTGYDTEVLIGGVALVVAVALASALVPAARAARIDPMRALRLY